jgi:hypothetical protein
MDRRGLRTEAVYEADFFGDTLTLIKPIFYSISDLGG